MIHDEGGGVLVVCEIRMSTFLGLENVQSPGVTVVCEFIKVMLQSARDGGSRVRKL